ncbi:glucosyltransferase domain-containing protein [Proteus mirabilis]|uniref:glucosyltransferase domain-containing protein n=1 Tax=Proteus mirabilis TaxID=584 RepID=UPI0034E50133
MNRIKLSILLISMFFLPFILADIKYYDDLGRINLGYFYWSGDGRPLTEIFMRVITFGSPLTDLSPYTYIISIAAASISVVSLSNKIDRTAGVVIAATCFISWNYISNAAYRFDNATMTMSLMFCILAASKEFTKYNTLTKTIFIIASLCLYQPSFGAYLCIAITIFLIDATNGRKQTTRDIISKISPALISIILYKTIIVTVFVFGDYAEKNSAMISSPYDLIRNTLNYFGFIKSNTPKLLFSAYISLFFLSLVCSWHIAFSRREVIVGIVPKLVIMLSPILILLSVPSFLLLMKKIPDTARAYTAFGTSFACFSIIIYSVFTSIRKTTTSVIAKLTVVACSAYILYTLSAVSAFTGASKIQIKKYDSIAYTASMYANKNNQQCLSIIGTIPDGEGIEIVKLKYKFINNILPAYADNYLSWMVHLINEYGYKMKSCGYDEWLEIKKRYKTIDVIYRSSLFTIRSDDKTLVIEFAN